MQRRLIAEQMMVGKKIKSHDESSCEEVDVNLSHHLMAHKISRQQFCIRFEHNAVSKEENSHIRFVLKNLSKRPLLVDGEKLFKDQECTLPDKTTIEVFECFYSNSNYLFWCSRNYCIFFLLFDYLRYQHMFG